MPEHPLLLSFLPSPSLSPALPTTLSYVFFRLFRRPASTVCSTRASPSNKRSLSPSPPPPPPRARSALFPLYVLICGSPTHLDSMGYFWGCIPPASPSPSPLPLPRRLRYSQIVGNGANVAAPSGALKIPEGSPSGGVFSGSRTPVLCWLFLFSPPLRSLACPESSCVFRAVLSLLIRGPLAHLLRCLCKFVSFTLNVLRRRQPVLRLGRAPVCACFVFFWMN